MSKEIKIGDRIKLSKSTKEFNFEKYVEDHNSYSFNSIHLVDTSKKVPIVFSGYEEKILKITLENEQKFGYTKSFKIHISKALNHKEIIVNDTSEEQLTNKEIKCFENFANSLIDETFNIPISTKSESRNRLNDAFQHFFRTYFKKELKEIEENEKNLANESFFSKTWKRYLPREKHEELRFKVKDIFFIQSLPPTKYRWYHQFVLEAVEKGIDKKTSAHLSFSGLYITRKKFILPKVEHFKLKILPTNYVQTDSQIYKVSFWGNEKKWQEFETENLWKNEKFMTAIEKVIESPVF